MQCFGLLLLLLAVILVKGSPTASVTVAQSEMNMSAADDAQVQQHHFV